METTEEQKKRAIVVGASSGIGRAVAERLIEQGWLVGVAARRIDKLNEIRGAKAMKAIDVCEEESPKDLLDLVSELGGIDLYFHASGIGKQNINLLPDVEMNTIKTNDLGFTRMVDTIYNYMAKHSGGHIAVISSIAGTKGLGAAPSYSATKAFQNIYIQALDQQAHIRKLPILFTDIRPGFVDTDLLDDEHHYPLMLDKEKVADAIMWVIEKKQRVCVIDWRWRILTILWKWIPNAIWTRLPIVSSDKQPISSK